MAKKKNPNKRPVVWQDIIPAKDLPKKRKKRPFKTFEIKIALPSFFRLQKITKLKQWLLKTPKKAWAVVVLLIITLIIGLTYYLQSSSTTTTQNQDTGLNKKPIDTGADSNQPKYQTIIPDGKTISQLGGWTRVSPINSNPVFAYVDYIANIPIRVSQQPIPDEFKQENTAAQIDQLAIGYNANEKITVGDVSVHIGTNAKGPQSVIFIKDGLLILITSSAKITNDQWASYISSLQ